METGDVDVVNFGHVFWTGNGTLLALGPGCRWVLGRCYTNVSVAMSACDYCFMSSKMANFVFFAFWSGMSSGLDRYLAALKYLNHLCRWV